MNKCRNSPTLSFLALLALACQLAISFGHVHVGDQSHASHTHGDHVRHGHHHTARHHHDGTPHSISPAQRLYLKLVAKLKAAKAKHSHAHHDHHHHDHSDPAPGHVPHEEGEPCFACVLKNLAGSVVLPVAAELKIDAPRVSRTGFFTDRALVACQRTKYTQARAPPPIELLS